MSAPKLPRKRLASGTAIVPLCAGALALNLLLVAGLLLILVTEGPPGFWPGAVEELTLDDGTRLLGELMSEEPIPRTATDATPGTRVQIKVGNRDLTGEDYVWVPRSRIRAQTRPLDAVLLERLEGGAFFGRMKSLHRGEEVLARGADETFSVLGQLTEEKAKDRARIEDLERDVIADVSYELKALSQRQKSIDARDPGRQSESARAEHAEIQREVERLEAVYEGHVRRLDGMRASLDQELLLMETADGREHAQIVGQVLVALRPNRLSLLDRVGVFLRRGWDFLSQEPRKANTEGGILPAIFGTVMMVVLMSLVAVPLGVLAAVYLREYAHQGALVRVVRIAVNNLAGTPSIVFGIFGLGFFVYTLGGAIDQVLFSNALPNPTFGTGGILWASVTLALLTVPVVIVATEEGLAAVPNSLREASLALGSTKWETVRRVVLPASGPAIMTGAILSMARAAGEVAPLMILGMVKSAPDLPLDGRFPFLHLERKFMHMGFHIYDLGLQTANIEATRPLVFTTALLLIFVVTAMNLVAIAVRNRLRRRYRSSAI